MSLSCEGLPQEAPPSSRLSHLWEEHSGGREDKSGTLIIDNVSRRSLGKILLSTLESCSDPQHGKAHILEVLNALYHELAACEILSTGGPLQRTQSQQSLNALIVSC
ncbi:unnamed protein product [Pleuronectes platessa]|uniref:Uncharacterized protein n=1 Tax=Pleuronectes platessa TaxID=8262 RepID=A0A9N7VUR5_PLEPL|nr:unnamed protein product [Pleuronectes platessa]